MSNITDKFNQVCKMNSSRVAFYYIKSNRIIMKTFSELYNDVEKVKVHLKNKGIKPNDRVFAFASPDYHLLVYMLAIFKLGASVMYVDIFTKQDSFKNFFEKYQPDCILVSNKTIILKPFFRYARKIKKTINVDKEISSRTMIVDEANDKVDDDAPALITATTGSSGKPKAFIRTHKDLLEQLSLIHNNMKPVSDDEIILTTSYIYAFANLIQGFATVLPNINLSMDWHHHGIPKKIKTLSMLKITTIMTSPDFCLNLPNIYPNLMRLYFGGAILNYFEAKKIYAKYKNADIYYIYGSTECALIAGINLSEYIQHLSRFNQCLLGDICNGVEVKIDESGHILVGSKALIRQELDRKFTEKYYDTNDIGRIKNGKLIYIGRKGTNLVLSGKRYYANEVEQQLILEFRHLKKCAALQENGNNYLFVEGSIDKSEIKRYLLKRYEANFHIIILRRIPRDPKHHTKINYMKLRNILIKSVQRL